MMMKS